MSISLEKLSFNPIKEIIKFKDEEGIEQSITVFNPNEEKQQELQSILLKYTDIKNKKLTIPPFVTIKEIMGRVTDIEIPNDDNVVNEILNNPNFALKKATISIVEIVGNIQEINLRLLNALDKIYGLGNLSDEEIITLLAQQNKLEDMINELEVNNIKGKETNKPKRKYTRKKKVAEDKKEENING